MKHKEIDAIKKEQMIILFNHYHSILDKVQLHLDIEMGDKEHLMNLCELAVEKYDEFFKLDGDNSKVNRWLGYIQGILIANGITTVNKERDYTRPFLTKHQKVEKEKPESNSGEKFFQEFVDVIGLKPQSISSLKVSIDSAKEVADRFTSMISGDGKPSMWNFFSSKTNHRENMEPSLARKEINKSKYYNEKMLCNFEDPYMKEQYKKVCFLIKYCEWLPESDETRAHQIKRVHKIINNMYYHLISVNNICRDGGYWKGAKYLSKINYSNKINKEFYRLPTTTGRIFNAVHINYVKERFINDENERGLAAQSELIKLKSRAKNL